MLYGDYLVTRCELKAAQRGGREPYVQNCYVCEMENSRGHKIGFTLALDGCVGAPESRAQCEAVLPHIQVGKLLHCEFALQWQEGFFQLCLSGLIKCRARRWDDEGAEISPRAFFDPQRGYLAAIDVYGEWVYPGLITLSGEVYLPTRFDAKNYPVFSDDWHPDSKKSHLAWKSK